MQHCAPISADEVAPRLYGRRWAKKRAKQLKLESLCRLCSFVGRITPATVADHIEPHRNDPVKFWHGPLQSLCETCHNAVKQAQEKSGHLRGSAENGLPLDPAHHWHRGGGVESLGRA